MGQVKRPQSDEHIERLIDESLQETFPASDPPSPAIAVTRAGKVAHEPEDPPMLPRRE